MEIYNEAVKDLLCADGTPLRLLDDPEVNIYLKRFLLILIKFFSDSYVFLFLLQRGTIVDKLTEVTVRDSSHLKELLSICEGKKVITHTSIILNVINT